MNQQINIDRAEITALKALFFISKDKKQAIDFFRTTGIEPSNVREESKKDGFYLSILDYLMNNEQLLIDFCKAEGENPSNIKKYYDLIPMK